MMGARRRLLSVALALCTLTALARPAAAYFRSVTNDSTAANPVYLSWQSSCETVTIYLNGFSDMTADEVAKSIAAAAAAWGPDQVTCLSPGGDSGVGSPYFQIIPQLSTGGSVPGAVNDGKNSIIFQTTGWDEYPDALAFTKVWKEPSGKIVDADIEINASPNAPNPLANLDPGVAPPQHGQFRVDLQALMTHEFGHFLGLAHTCLSGIGGDIGDNPPPGTPSCSDASPQALAAVMYPIIDYESITKRVLTADDAAGVCAIYPPSGNPPICTQNAPDDGCGCAAAGASPGAVASAALAVLALVLPGRRRRRR
jgi:MYXO-CTERM domain-containing protein